MVERVTRASLEETTRFLNRSPEINHYILSDLHWLGLEHPMMEVYFQRARELTAVLLRVGSGFTLYAPGDFDQEEMAAFLRRFNYKLISGKTTPVRQLMGQLRPPLMVGHQTFSVLEDRQPRDVARRYPVVLLDAGNIRRYVHHMAQLRAEVDEFSQPFSIERTLMQFEQRSQRGILAMANGQAVCMALTSGELPGASLVVSVCTRPSHRGRGYAASVVWSLCHWLQSEGKKPFLYWDAPQAGRVYHRLGFVDRAEWRIVRY